MRMKNDLQRHDNPTQRHNDSHILPTLTTPSRYNTNLEFPLRGKNNHHSQILHQSPRKALISHQKQQPHITFFDSPPKEACKLLSPDSNTKLAKRRSKHHLWKDRGKSGKGKGRRIIYQVSHFIITNKKKTRQRELLPKIIRQKQIKRTKRL